MKQVIVVGAGNWGKNLIRNFYQLDALAGVAEVNPQLRDAIAEQYPDIPLFTNYEQALASTTPAIVLATPAPTHFKLGWSALAAGKDLFVEKPMTLETSEARQLAEY
ncbi:MAG: Gfo/Idh/MocA family protein, partial [Spirulinaceae cyanobacterium]